MLFVSIFTLHFLRFFKVIICTVFYFVSQFLLSTEWKLKKKRIIKLNELTRKLVWWYTYTYDISSLLRSCWRSSVQGYFGKNIVVFLAWNLTVFHSFFQISSIFENCTVCKQPAFDIPWRKFCFQNCNSLGYSHFLLMWRISVIYIFKPQWIFKIMASKNHCMCQNRVCVNVLFKKVPILKDWYSYYF